MVKAERNKKIKLIAVETHPIQYKAPLFRELAADGRFELTVCYAMIPDAVQQGAGFGTAFAWDVPLLDGYTYRVLNNRSRAPSVTAFFGCDTPDIYDVLKEEKPDAVLVNGWVVKTCLQALWACKRLNIPCMVRGEANLLRPRAWWKHGLHRLLLRQYSAWLAIGSANRAFYEFHGCNPAAIFPAPYAVDNAYFATRAAELFSERNSLRDGFGIPPEACAFLFVGKLEPKKRLMDVLQALKRLRSLSDSKSFSTSAFLLVVGDGELNSACKKFAVTNGLPVTFAGFVNQSELPEAYAAADALVLPSDAGETWGLVVNEAMASGRPAIVSSLAGCCEDLIMEGQTGYSFECGDIERLSELMRNYLRNPLLAREQGCRAAGHIDHFSFGVIANSIAATCRYCTRDGCEEC